MIYCVEDDASIRELTVYALNASGFSALGLECAEALWQQLGKEQHLHPEKAPGSSGHGRDTRDSGNRQGHGV